MKNTRTIFCSLFLFLMGNFSVVLAAEGDLDDEASIRNARHAFNRAIRNQDVEAIGRFFAPEYHIITGRSVQSHGAEGQRGEWESWFAGGSDIYCQRDIRELRINSKWGLAEELGDWNCYQNLQGETVHASGVYAEKWQRAEVGQWLIQSEVFTTMACEGADAGCNPPETID